VFPVRHSGPAALGLLLTLGVHAEPPPVAAFARGEQVIDAAISPDGHYLAVLTTIRGLRAVMVKDERSAASAFAPVMSSTSDDNGNGFSITWCRWATDTRLLCGLRATVHNYGTVYPVSRLAGVDADGKHLTALVQNNDSVAGQWQDAIVDWSPGTPDTVLIETQASLLDDKERFMGPGSGIIGNAVDEFPSVYELNVVTGRMRKQTTSRPPIRSFLSDRHGNIRLGWGIVGDTDEIEYYARDIATASWHRILKYQFFTRDAVLKPVAVCADRPDCVYAIGPSEGRNALWRLDLTGASAPTLEFSHPAVDIDGPVFSYDGRLLGVSYETDRPFLYYTDPERERVLQSLKAALPNAFIVIRDATRDQQRYVVRASSDVDSGTYYLLDMQTKNLSRIGTGYPDLDPAKLGRMQTVSYRAQDGTSIPAYLTAPPGLRAEHLPLVVMPHGGPIARDRWRFNFLRAFLVSRGYAVLQMNFRGSSGYGGSWFFDAHQDWGGLTYSDIADGARWAVREGIADPQHLAVVGWSFGGYAALLGAVRDSGLFRCSVSIAGISDLSLLESERSRFVGGEITRQQIGTDPAKLKADSPRKHAGDVRIPVLMIHGDNDFQVNVEQSEAMDRALTKAGKPHELVLIKGADHALSRESDRTALLTAIEHFLAANIGLGAKTP
jgi:dipeptidyl aminopeptidase/acylaminoacyl peptidase